MHVHVLKLSVGYMYIVYTLYVHVHVHVHCTSLPSAVRLSLAVYCVSSVMEIMNLPPPTAVNNALQVYTCTLYTTVTK